MLSGPTSRYVRAETGRLLLAPVTVGTVLLFSAFQVYSVVAWTGACASPSYAAASGGYSCTTRESVSYLLPLVAVLVGGTAAASERSRGADVLLAVRGLVGPAYSRARILAAGLATGIAVLISGFLAILAGVVAHPWRAPLVKDPSVTNVNGPAPHPGDPFPWLWEHAPLLNDVAVVVIVAIAAVAVAAVGTAVGMWLRNPVAVVPIILGAMFLARYAIPSPLDNGLNPEWLLDFSPDSQLANDLSPALRPVVHLAVWLVLLAGAFPAAAAGARRALR